MQSSSGSGDSELSLEWTSLGKAAGAKLRSKRYVSRSGNLRVCTGGIGWDVVFGPTTHAESGAATATELGA